MYQIPYKDIDYCKGMPYRKRIRLWNCVFQWNPKPLREKGCGHIIDNKHKAIAQHAPDGTKDTWGNEPLFKQDGLYVIPEQSMYDIFTSLLSAM